LSAADWLLWVMLEEELHFRRISDINRATLKDYGSGGCVSDLAVKWDDLARDSAL
jgi:hypothetical protein